MKFLEDEELRMKYGEHMHTPLSKVGYILYYTINTGLEYPFVEWLHEDITFELPSYENEDEDEDEDEDKDKLKTMFTVGYKGFVEIKIDSTYHVVVIIHKPDKKTDQSWITVNDALDNYPRSIISHTLLKVYNPTFPTPQCLYLCGEHEYSFPVKGIGMATLFSNHPISSNNKKYAVFVEGALQIINKDQDIKECIPKGQQREDGTFDTEYDCIMFYKGIERFVAVKTIGRFIKL